MSDSTPCPNCDGREQHLPTCQLACEKCGKVPGPEKPGLSLMVGTGKWTCFDCGYANGPPVRPHRRWSVKILLHANTHEAMARVLETIATEVREHRMGRNISGGYDYGYSVDVQEDPQQTPERYIEQLEAFNKAERG